MMRIFRKIDISSAQFRFLVSILLLMYLFFFMGSSIVNFLPVLIPTIVSALLTDISYKRQEKKDVKDSVESRTKEVVFALNDSVTDFLNNVLKQEIRAEIAKISNFEDIGQEGNSLSARSNYRSINKRGSTEEQLLESIAKNLTKSYLHNTYQNLRSQNLISERLFARLSHIDQ
jgi:glutamyl-tRNA reductase